MRERALLARELTVSAYESSRNVQQSMATAATESKSEILGSTNNFAKWHESIELFLFLFCLLLSLHSLDVLFWWRWTLLKSIQRTHSSDVLFGGADHLTNSRIALLSLPFYVLLALSTFSASVLTHCAHECRSFKVEAFLLDSFPPICCHSLVTSFWSASLCLRFCGCLLRSCYHLSLSSLSLPPLTHVVVCSSWLFVCRLQQLTCAAATISFYLCKLSLMIKCRWDQWRQLSRCFGRLGRLVTFSKAESLSLIINMVLPIRCICMPTCSLFDSTRTPKLSLPDAAALELAANLAAIKALIGI